MNNECKKCGHHHMFPSKYAKCMYQMNVGATQGEMELEICDCIEELPDVTWFCPHLQKHTETSWRYEPAERDGVSYIKEIKCIITYCADCGEELKRVDIKSK